MTDKREVRGSMESIGRIDKRKKASIYIVDSQHRIVYFNKALKVKFPELEVGEICYEGLCGRNEICDSCPLNEHPEGDTILYNRIIQKWVEVRVGQIEWPGCGPCTLFLTNTIDEYNKNLLYNLTRRTTYDELLELNVSESTYKILFHEKGKYVVPDMEGTVEDFLRITAETAVHPDDKSGYLEFWDWSRIIDKYQDHDDEIMKGEFRAKLTDGGYCWVEQVVVPLRHGNNDEGIVICFIRDINEQKEKDLAGKGPLSGSQETDALTGLYPKPVFLRKAREYLDGRPESDHCLMAVDIEHFKLFNEWYGEKEGDRFLATLGSLLRNAQQENGGLAGYMGRDDFVILLPYDRELLAGLEQEMIDYVKKRDGNTGFLPAFGIYVASDPSVPVSTMYDRALIAQESVKGNYACRVSWYDEAMMRQMEDEQLLLKEVQKGLEQNEFVFYAQPQCNMVSGKIVGLESLVRWNHPERGVISPDLFVPMLEKNGLITKLDRYLWDMVSKKVRGWIDRGRRPVPISVNVSRIDIYAVNVADVFKGLIKKYDLPPALLEIEITESVYVQDYERIMGVVDELRKAGFTVLMDDFGSGYSSLNMLKDVNVDVLKIDMKFLKMDFKSTERGTGILEAIVKMAKRMGLRMIVEGVETRDQAELLLDIGCLYGQGYYYYRPMPIEALERVLSDETNIDYRGIRAKRIETLKVSEIFGGDVESEFMLNSILGGLAIYEVYGGKLALLQVNEQYYKITGDNPVDLAEKRADWLSFVHREDRKDVLALFERARVNPLGSQGSFRRYRMDGRIIWLQLRVYFMREQDGHQMFCGAIGDITEQMKKEQELESS